MIEPHDDVHLLRSFPARCDEFVDRFFEDVKEPPKSPRRRRLFHRFLRRRRDKLRDKQMANNRSPDATEVMSDDEHTLIQVRHDSKEVREMDIAWPEASSMASSQLTTASSTTRSRHTNLLQQWKLKMGRSIKCVLGKEPVLKDQAVVETREEPVEAAIEDEDIGLYIYPADAVEAVYCDRRFESTFEELCLPNLDESTEGRDDSPNPGMFRSTSTSSMSKILPRRNLVVSFDQTDCAQLVLQTSSDEEDMFAFPQIEESDYESDRWAPPVSRGQGRFNDRLLLQSSNSSEDPSLFSAPSEDPSLFGVSRKLGAAFPHPSHYQEQLIQSSSSSSSDEERPLGISCPHPSWIESKATLAQVTQVWNMMHSPEMAGNVTNPPSPIAVETSQARWGCHDWSPSSNSTLTISDVGLNNHHKCAYTTIPKTARAPRWVCDSGGDFPFDEVVADETEMPPRQHPAGCPIDMATNVEDFLRRSFNHTDYEDEYDESGDQERPQCACLKCSVSSMYANLLESRK